MKIEINLKIILMIILLIFLNKINIYILFILFIVCHEFSHMFIGILLGFKAKKLSLNPLGVSIEFYNYDENNKKKRFKRIITYFAGPLINFLFAFVFSFLDIELVFKTKIIYTNLLIGIFNLIPMVPLDGGKILREFLRNFYNSKITSLFMLYLSKSILIIISIIYSIVIFKIRNFMIFLLIMYLWYLYIIEERKEKLVIRVYESLEK